MFQLHGKAQTLQKVDVWKHPYGWDKGTLTRISLLCHLVSDPLNVQNLGLAHTQSMRLASSLVSYSRVSCEWGLPLACYSLLNISDHVKVELNTSTSEGWLAQRKTQLDYSLQNELLILTGKVWSQEKLFSGWMDIGLNSWTGIMCCP